MFFHTNRFKTGSGQYPGARRMALHPMTADPFELLAAARRGVEAAWRDGYAYTKVGIMLDDLVAAELRPRTLFQGDVERHDRLMTALDEVDGMFGKSTAVLAAQGFRRDWKMRAEDRCRLGRCGSRRCRWSGRTDVCHYAIEAS